MRARVWKERGRWLWDVSAPALNGCWSTGSRGTWREALDGALEAVTWISAYPS